jgi:hypothetical protein
VNQERQPIMEDDELLSEQLAYYHARANEYDEWFLRQGRYDRGPDHRTAWFRQNDLRLTLVQGGQSCQRLVECE